MYKLMIKEVRLSRGLKQCELAKILGISKSFLSYIENGKSDVKLSLFLRIALVLEAEFFELVQLNDQK